MCLNSLKQLWRLFYSSLFLRSFPPYLFGPSTFPLGWKKSENLSLMIVFMWEDTLQTLLFVAIGKG